MPSEKIALITGANKGIGFEIARQLGDQGIVVLLGVRDEVRGKQAADSLAGRGIKAAPIRLDVTDNASIAEAALHIQHRHGRLDILVNNAGIAGGFIGPPSQATAAQLREVYETNVFGVVAVTNAMLPLLRKSAAGRIVNVSSNVGSLTLNAEPEGTFAAYNLLTYQSSKTALNAITVAYAKELRDTPIKVNSANPGFTATDLNGHRGYQTTEQGAAVPVRLATIGQDGPTGANLDENGTVPW